MRKEVLIVEAERRMADALVLRLTARGYGVSSAASVEEAQQAIAERYPALMVIALPDPEPLLRVVRGDPRGLTVFLFGGTDHPIRSAEAARAAGADAFFRRPAGLDALVAEVAAILGPALPSRVAEEPPPSIDESLDFSELNALLWSEPPRRPAPLSTPMPLAQESVDYSELEPFMLSARPQEVAPPDVEESTDRPLRMGSSSLPPPRSPASAPPAARLTQTDRPGQGYSPPRPPVPVEDVTWQARLQPGRTLPLAERSLGEALAAAAALGTTGRLEVATGGVLRRVFLDAGRAVFADSSDPSEDLAAHLVREGLVTRGMVLEARERALLVGATAEEVLIEQGYASPDAIYRALRDHVVARIIALFGLEAGEALVIQGGPRPLDPVDLGLPPGRLVLDGIRRRYGRLRLYRAFGTPATVPRVRRRPDDDSVGLRADEDAVVRACDGRRTITEVAQVAGIGEMDTLAILHALAVLGFIESPLGAGGSALPALDGALTARAQQARTADELPGFNDLVARKLADVQTADYFTILEVPRGATGAELEAAWETLHRRFDPHRVRRDGALYEAVEEISLVLTDARIMLTDARRRSRYEAALMGG